MSQSNNFDKNYQFFVKNRNVLVKKYAGKYVVITNQEVAGSFDDENEAYIQAATRFGLGNFFIHKCIKESQEPKIIFHSRVTFA